jgi:glycosyltransferase involved in cell wall biosynthesis
MWYGCRVAVIFPAYNEEDNVAHAIDDFLNAGGGGIVDEVIAVDNNSRDRTAACIKATRATYVLETKQGYGHALQRGLAEAASRGADLIVMAEPDGTFAGKDVLKLLAFSDDFDLVLGTRTTKELIWQEANMGRFLRWGNWAVAKLLQVLHDGPSLSDCGCTLRLVRTDAYRVFASSLTVGRSHFLPEMVCLALGAGLRMVEVPVNYRGRVGESKITGSLSTTLRVGTRMIMLILGYWARRRLAFGAMTPLPVAPARTLRTLR